MQTCRPRKDRALGKGLVQARVTKVVLICNALLYLICSLLKIFNYKFHFSEIKTKSASSVKKLCVKLTGKNLQPKPKKSNLNCLN